MERWATFDCYGTLVDWNAGIRAELGRLFGEDNGGRLLARYHEIEPQVQAESPEMAYREVMATVLTRGISLSAATQAQYCVSSAVRSAEISA